jgi:tryptophan synthase alpha chain
MKMENRINRMFATKTNNILSLYFCAGYPEVNNTAEVIRTLEKNGVDMIEIGIPFSDPMADGIVIQKASTQALRNGMSLKKLFLQLENIRKDVQIPLLLMGYLNPILQYGIEPFCRSCHERGIDGCIIPDLPFDDYLNDFKPVAEQYNLKIILLITPATSEARLRLIDRHTDGFIYMVSSAATTGTQHTFDADSQAYFRRIHGMSLKNPRLIGFGISNRQTFRTACNHASGAIIGSKFVTLLGEHKSADLALRQLKAQIGL